MCLTLTDTTAKIAEEYILCYKMIERHKIKGDYRSFYEFYPIELGSIYHSEIKIMYNEVYKALHSYVYESECIGDCSTCSTINGFSGLVVKCIIPKGSEYYVGTFSGCKGYASNCIVYTKEIIHEFCKD
jgi:hypothetical protein